MGRNIYPLIDKILDDLDGVLDEVSKLKALRKGLVRIAAPPDGLDPLPEVIAAYGVAHPRSRSAWWTARWRRGVPRLLRRS